jgi:hypothetical protein
MKTIFYLIILSSLLLFSCTDKKTSNPLLNYNIELSCPCELQRDSAKERDVYKKTTNQIVPFSCTDFKNDQYKVEVLERKIMYFSNKKLLNYIDSTLNFRNIEHEKITISGLDAMVIDYGKTKEIEIFGNDYSYYLIGTSNDFLDQKFERLIKSIKISK